MQDEILIKKLYEPPQNPEDNDSYDFYYYTPNYWFSSLAHANYLWDAIKADFSKVSPENVFMRRRNTGHFELILLFSCELPDDFDLSGFEKASEDFLEEIGE